MYFRVASSPPVRSNGIMTGGIIYPARDAATLVIFRESHGNRPELLMMERSREMDFAGGALVFPGGAVDEDDAETAALFAGPLSPVEARTRVAAIRETLEESGLAIGFSQLPEAALACELRLRLAAGKGFAGLLAEYGLALELGQLVPFARWCPNFNHPRNYDTRFYLARLPDGSHEAEADATENVHLLWTSAEDMLARAERGEARVMFPTKRNLERLAQFDDFDAARAHALSIEIRTVSPWPEERADGTYLCIPDDLGYPVTAELMSQAMRGV